MPLRRRGQWDASSAHLRRIVNPGAALCAGSLPSRSSRREEDPPPGSCRTACAATPLGSHGQCGHTVGSGVKEGLGLFLPKLGGVDPPGAALGVIVSAVGGMHGSGGALCAALVLKVDQAGKRRWWRRAGLLRRSLGLHIQRRENLPGIGWCPARRPGRRRCPRSRHRSKRRDLPRVRVRQDQCR